jgi:hypothetical protein
MVLLPPLATGERPSDLKAALGCGWLGLVAGRLRRRCSDWCHGQLAWTAQSLNSSNRSLVSAAAERTFRAPARALEDIGAEAIAGAWLEQATEEQIQAAILLNDKFIEQLQGHCRGQGELNYRWQCPLNWRIQIVAPDFRTTPTIYPQVRHMRLSYRSIEIIDHGDRRQVFGIQWIRTGFGRHRPIFVCSCGYGAIRLFGRYGTYACKACHGAVHMCQRQSRRGRNRLRACKLRLELGGQPDVNEAIAPKAKWRHRRTYQRVRERIRALERAIGPRCFCKPLDDRIFAYRVR